MHIRIATDSNAGQQCVAPTMSSSKKFYHIEDMVLAQHCVGFGVFSKPRDLKRFSDNLDIHLLVMHEILYGIYIVNADQKSKKKLNIFNKIFGKFPVPNYLITNITFIDCLIRLITL